MRRGGGNQNKNKNISRCFKWPNDEDRRNPSIFLTPHSVPDERKGKNSNSLTVTTQQAVKPMRSKPDEIEIP